MKISYDLTDFAQVISAKELVSSKVVLEWEYGVLFPDYRSEPSFVGIESSARYFMDRPNSSIDKDSHADDKKVLVKRIPAGPWEQADEREEKCWRRRSIGVPLPGRKGTTMNNYTIETVGLAEQAQIELDTARAAKIDPEELVATHRVLAHLIQHLIDQEGDNHE